MSSMAPFTLARSKKRCPKGSRRNIKTGRCQSNNKILTPSSFNFSKVTNFFTRSVSKKKCPRGTRRVGNTGKCVNKPYKKMSKFNQNWENVYKYHKTR